MPQPSDPLPGGTFGAWPKLKKFWETDNWPGYEADSKNGRLPGMSSRNRGSLYDGRTAAEKDDSDRVEPKWWHVSDKQLETHLKKVGDKDTLDEILRAAAQGKFESCNRTETPEDELWEGGDTVVPLKQPPNRIHLVIRFMQTGDELELHLPPRLLLAVPGYTVHAAETNQHVALSKDRPGRALRALMEPPQSCDNEPLSARSHREKLSLKGIVAELVDRHPDDLRFYSKGVALHSVIKNGATLQSLLFRNGDVVGVLMSNGRGGLVPLRELVGNRLKKAAAWYPILRPCWRWNNRPNIFAALGGKNDGAAGTAFNSYDAYRRPETDITIISPQRHAALQKLGRLAKAGK